MDNIQSYTGHIGIPVQDVETSVNFYQKLGFDILERHQLDSGNGGKNHIAFATKNGVLLEFYQLHGETTSKREGAINHVAIKVENLGEVQNLLGELDIPLVDGPTSLPFGQNGMTYMMIEGPDRERIEFDEFH
ncbi:VOC family protein [Vibrio sp. STUT-A11]|uniref:VOC family protein n=1 Tax=Vibrio sp. STUT-A11 TaxID=2976236 RepID=UPI00222EAD18|nr:VOC family protein [Vibrio sp. STUT-A11]BDR13264.1 hypothetical protein VspSTUT11_12400 [Vibrio sp. STUT-A11]